MASSKEYLHFILEQLSDLEAVSYRSMMGEFILYYRGKIVGGIYDDRLLVKKTSSALELMPAAMYDELSLPKQKNNSVRKSKIGSIGGIVDELYSDHKRKY